MTTFAQIYHSIPEPIAFLLAAVILLMLAVELFSRGFTASDVSRREHEHSNSRPRPQRRPRC